MSFSKSCERQTVWNGAMKFYMQKLHFKIYSDFFFKNELCFFDRKLCHFQN